MRPGEDHGRLSGALDLIRRATAPGREMTLGRSRYVAVQAEVARQCADRLLASAERLERELARANGRIDGLAYELGKERMRDGRLQGGADDARRRP